MKRAGDGGTDALRVVGVTAHVHDVEGHGNGVAGLAIQVPAPAVDADAVLGLLAHFAKADRFESVQFKYLLDTTRKYALPLLDYFDKINVTRHAGNTPYLKAKR